MDLYGEGAVDIDPASFLIFCSSCQGVAITTPSPIIRESLSSFSAHVQLRPTYYVEYSSKNVN